MYFCLYGTSTFALGGFCSIAVHTMFIKSYVLMAFKSLRISPEEKKKRRKKTKKRVKTIKNALEQKKKRKSKACKTKKRSEAVKKKGTEGNG